MTNETTPIGSIHVSPKSIATIAYQSALRSYGVVGMAAKNVVDGLAQTLVKDPTLVLADEPTANLDSTTASEIIDLLKAMNEKRGTTFIFSTHDPLVMEQASRLVMLRDGLIESDDRRGNGHG